MYNHLAKLAEKIGNELHEQAIDPQEDSSDFAGEKIAKAIRDNDLHWTTEPPTQEGWYWTYDGSIDIRYIIPPATIQKGAEVYFLGPLPVPEFPTK